MSLLFFRGVEMFLEKSKDELADVFMNNLVSTNRGYNYYVDWSNIEGYDEFEIEINAIDVLIGCKDDQRFKNQFEKLLKKLPTVICIFPLLFGLSKGERKKALKGKYDLTVVSDTLGSKDNLSYTFPKSVKDLSNEDIEKYYDFFVKLGLKNLYQSKIEKSTKDYIIGVLVGMDSNGRKNRGGSAFELACQPIFEEVCKGLGLSLLIQKQFSVLRDYNFNISEDIANRKADFIVFDKEKSIAMNFEVNFYNGTGSKPEEIIDSYINRQNDLKKANINFSLVTDGNCWLSAKNQLQKGFRHLDYLINFNLLKNGILEEILPKVFKCQ